MNCGIDGQEMNTHAEINRPFTALPRLKLFSFSFGDLLDKCRGRSSPCVLSYCRRCVSNACSCSRCTRATTSSLCARVHKSMDELVSAVHGHTCSVQGSRSRTSLRCPWALMVSCWLLGFLWLAGHTRWWGVTANPVTQTAAARLIGGG